MNKKKAKRRADTLRCRSQLLTSALSWHFCVRQDATATLMQNGTPPAGGNSVVETSKAPSSHHTVGCTEKKSRHCPNIYRGPGQKAQRRAPVSPPCYYRKGRAVTDAPALMRVSERRSRHGDRDYGQMFTLRRRACTASSLASALFLAETDPVKRVAGKVVRQREQGGPGKPAWGRRVCFVMHLRPIGAGRITNTPGRQGKRRTGFFSILRTPHLARKRCGRPPPSKPSPKL